VKASTRHTVAQTTRTVKASVWSGVMFVLRLINYCYKQR
jgi:hypothetical protein